MPPLPATLIGARAIKDRLRAQALERGNVTVSCAAEDVTAETAVQEAINAHFARDRVVEPGACLDDATDATGSYVTRAKVRRVPTRDEMEEAAAAMDALGIRTRLPCFTAEDHDTFAAWHDQFSEYCAMHNVAYRTRHSLSSHARNKKLQKTYEAKVETASQTKEKCAPVLRLIPEKLKYFQRVYQCVHAEYQADRSTGVRQQSTTIYTKCPARITAEAVWDERKKAYGIVTRMENRIHNHVCTEAIFTSYLNNSFIEDAALFERVKAQVETGGNPQQIRDGLSTATGAHYTRSMYSNLQQYHLGGGLAALNLELLLERLQGFDGSRCVLVEDQEKTVCGVICQTRMQRELFERYGDNLVLDWTHNSNNLGFYLGSLLVISATGKGVPVFDFLCLSQGKAMMTMILEYFVECNPTAPDTTRSFVIDKDMKERSAINKVLPLAAIVLCQFHVIKCFKTVIASGDYKFDKPLRPVAIKILKNMVYAQTKEAFKRQKALLRAHLSGDEHLPFHDYMKRNWYTIKGEWSDYLRGKVFTAGNTTTNVIESHWGQYKRGLGKRRRIDHCVEAVHMRGTAILRRERNELVAFSSRRYLFGGVHPFVRPLLHELSKSRAKLVRRQWVKYSTRASSFISHVGSTEEEFRVSSSFTSDALFQVTTGAGIWSCSCRFATSHMLPCRHQFFVAKGVLGYSHFPVDAIAPRWRMALSVSLISPLQTAIDELATVRVSKLPKSAGQSANAAKSEALPTTTALAPARKKSIRYLKLHRREVADTVVLDAVEKRNIAVAQFVRVLAPMMELSTPKFWACSSKLEEALVGVLASIRALDISSSSSATAAVSPNHGAPEPTFCAVEDPPASGLCDHDADYGVGDFVADSAGDGACSPRCEVEAFGHDDGDDNEEAPGTEEEEDGDDEELVVDDDEDDVDEEEFQNLDGAGGDVHMDVFKDLDLRPLSDVKSPSRVLRHDYVGSEIPFPSPLRWSGGQRFSALKPEDSSTQLTALLNQADEDIHLDPFGPVLLQKAVDEVSTRYSAEEWADILSERFDFLEARLNRSGSSPIARPPSSLRDTRTLRRRWTR